MSIVTAGGDCSSPYQLGKLMESYRIVPSDSRLMSDRERTSPLPLPLLWIRRLRVASCIIPTWAYFGAVRWRF